MFQGFRCVFFCEFPRLGKGYQTLTRDRNIPFFSPCHGNFLSLYFSSMGIKCPNIFPDVDFSHPKNSPRWDFSVPNIIWYGVLMSQKCPKNLSLIVPAISLKWVLSIPFIYPACGFIVPIISLACCFYVPKFSRFVSTNFTDLGI